MMNAQEATTAARAIAYPQGASRAETAALLFEYRQSLQKVNTEFREYLAGKYAKDLPSHAEDAVWNKAWEEGRFETYAYVENLYSGLVRFAGAIVLEVQ